MAIHISLYSSRTDEWPTPQSFFDQLNTEFQFTLDPCASADNTKCDSYFTKEDDGLMQDWGKHRVFCNPPYGRSMREWARKCYEATEGGVSRPPCAYSNRQHVGLYEWVYGKAEIRFVKGRLKFGTESNRAVSSMVAVFKPR
ncbi:MAG: adenine methyltransferase [Betaproteobacteria bacterium]|nr:adenine methyltransferase [Betaproteobacteria bacterium]